MRGNNFLSIECGPDHNSHTAELHTYSPAFLQPSSCNKPLTFILIENQRPESNCLPEGREMPVTFTTSINTAFSVSGLASCGHGRAPGAADGQMQPPTLRELPPSLGFGLTAVHRASSDVECAAFPARHLFSYPNLHLSFPFSHLPPFQSAPEGRPYVPPTLKMGV